MSRYLQQLRRIPDESKASQSHAFLINHREVIAAFDFFTVPNHYFRTLYCFFVIEHARRCVLHFNHAWPCRPPINNENEHESQSLVCA